MERLIEEYRRRWLEAFDNEWAKGYEMTITPQPWIPVSERVPDGDKELFLVARGENIGVAWWHSGPQRFIHEDIDNAWTPTHWMPLPEPPAD